MLKQQKSSYNRPLERIQMLRTHFFIISLLAYMLFPLSAFITNKLITTSIFDDAPYSEQELQKTDLHYLKPESFFFSEENLLNYLPDNIKQNNFPADITFLIADAKIDKNNTFKILEFGNGNGSRFKVLDHIQGIGSVWIKFWDYIFQFNLPVWYVGRYQGEAKELAWKHFIDKGGFYAPSIISLIHQPRFKKALQKKSLSSNKKSISDYQGIIVFKHYAPTQAQLNHFAKQYPNMLILNFAAQGYVSNKLRTNALFDTPALRNHRPQCRLYPKTYHAGLAQQIINDLQCNKFVIKPLNSGRGNGVIMATRKTLNKELQKILVDHACPLPWDNSQRANPLYPLTYDYWDYDRNAEFLVEECIVANPIEIQGKAYDATIRIVFALHYDNNELTLTYLDAYWKRPTKAIDEAGTLNEKHQSKHGPTYEESLGLFMDPEDFSLIKKTMNSILPQIYFNILKSFYNK